MFVLSQRKYLLYRKYYGNYEGGSPGSSTVPLLSAIVQGPAQPEELQTKVREDVTIMEKAPTKAPTNDTIKPHC